VTLYGDGAANQGQVFEAYNMAALWKLPVIYVCENNHFAMGTAVERSSASVQYYKRGDYIPGVQVNGMDVLTVRAATQFAVDFVKKNGPIVLEMDTYRYSGHSMSDPGTSYRTREDISKVRETRDPLTNVKAKLLHHNLASEDQLKEIEKRIKDKVEEAIKVATQAAVPNESELYADVYVNPPPFYRAVELPLSFHVQSK